MSPAVLEWYRSFPSFSFPDSVKVVPIVRFSDLSCSVTPGSNSVHGEACESKIDRGESGVLRQVGNDREIGGGADTPYPLKHIPNIVSTYNYLYFLSY